MKNEKKRLCLDCRQTFITTAYNRCLCFDCAHKRYILCHKKSCKKYNATHKKELQIYQYLYQQTEKGKTMHKKARLKYESKKKQQ